MFGSPVNRIRVTGYWASHALATEPNLTLSQRIREWAKYFSFLTVMFAVDVAFWSSKVRQWFRMRMGGPRESFEDELERTMRGIAKKNFGIEIAETAFDG